MPPLGIYARTSSTLTNTGLQPFQGSKPAPPEDRRWERWALQAVAREVVGGNQAKCYRVRRTPTVEVWQSSATGRANYHGLVTCGSVWACPVCSAKISERRRQELEAAIKANQDQDDDAYTALLTLTVPHHQADDLVELLAKLRKAASILRSGRWWKRFREWGGVVGCITALEVTHGANGWHPHFHILLLTQGVEEYRSDRDFLPELQADIYGRWLAACRRAGLPDPSEAHGVRLHGGERAARYVAKFGEDPGSEGKRWGLPEEMTRSHSKRGKAGSRTPWDLLRSILATGEAADVALFEEYARCFKGQRQLYWSPGLRDRLGLTAERTDEDLAAERGTDAVELGQLTAAEWRVIVAGDKQAVVLQVAEAEGWPGVQRRLAAWSAGEADQAASPPA